MSRVVIYVDGVCSYRGNVSDRTLSLLASAVGGLDETFEDISYIVGEVVEQFNVQEHDGYGVLSVVLPSVHVGNLDDQPRSKVKNLIKNELAHALGISHTEILMVRFSRRVQASTLERVARVMVVLRRPYFPPTS